MSAVGPVDRMSVSSPSLEHDDGRAVHRRVRQSPPPHRHSGEDVLGDLKDSGFNFAIGWELHVRRPALALSWINRQSQ
jgi:hypothetical protein